MNFILRACVTCRLVRSFQIFAVALLLTFLAGAVAAQRAITNPSVENPAFANNSFFFYSEAVVTGWLTSHPVVAGGCTNGGGPAVDCRPIERWSSSFNGVLPATGAGSRWVELNAYDNSMIYQSVCLTGGESFTYSFLHRGRSSTTTPDVAQFRLGIPAGLPAGSKSANSYSFPIVTVSTTSNGTVTSPPTGSGTINAPAAAGNGWVRYSGTYTFSGSSQLINIGFVALSTAGGAASGNFVDDWQIGLSPNVEFASSAASIAEGSDLGSNTPANRPAIRVSGMVSTAITVTFQVTGGSAFAVAGTDYSLTVPFASGNTSTTATVTIPVGTYDGTSAGSLFPIQFSISSDVMNEANETIVFSIRTAPGASIASAVGCGIAPVSISNYTILNDEAPTAANAEISGRLRTANGRGIGRAYVTLSGGGLSASVYALTNAFGFYRFTGIPAGQTYVLNVRSKTYRFDDPVRVVNLGEDLTGVDFTAQP